MMRTHVLLEHLANGHYHFLVYLALVIRRQYGKSF